MNYKEKYEKYKLKYLKLKEQIGGAPTKLHFIDNYVRIRKNNKKMDSVTMVLTTNQPTSVNVGARLSDRPGYNTFGFANQDYGYYYLTRCYSERLFNEEIFNGTLIRNLNIPVNFLTLRALVDSLRRLYDDLIGKDNRYYYYQISFDDHTFLILKHNNNYRILQSWMLKYQLENNIFDDDEFNCLPKFIVLLFTYTQYRCNFQRATDKTAHFNQLIQTIKETFDCGNIQAKQYLEEFKILYRFYFSKELHIIPGSQKFNLDLEVDSENFLCSKFGISPIHIVKFEFNPDNVLKNYFRKIRAVNTLISSTTAARSIKRFYLNKMGNGYPHYDLSNNVNISVDITNYIVNHNYKYMSRDYNYDSLMLNYIMKKYQIIKNVNLTNLIKLSNLKYSRDKFLVQITNTRLKNSNNMVLQMYRRIGMEQIAGNGSDVLTLSKEEFTLKLPKPYEDKELIKSDDGEEKIEFLKEYRYLQELIMSNESIIFTKLNDKSFWNSFQSINLIEHLEPSEITELTSIYQQIKFKLIDNLKNQAIQSIDQSFDEISVNLQLVTVLKILYEKPIIRDNMIEIIKERKMDFFELIQKITQSVIITDYFKFGLKKKELLVNEFDIIEYIMVNKPVISKFISEIPQDKLSFLDIINFQLCEINKVEENNISDQVIPNILSLISPNTNSDKSKIIMSMILFGGKSCQKYFNGLLDNEIFFVLKNKIPKEKI